MLRKMTTAVVISKREPMLSLSRQGRAEARAEIKHQTEEFLRRGGRIQQVDSSQERQRGACFFNYGPAQHD